MSKNRNRRYPPVRVGLFTLDSVNEMYAGRVAARTGDLVIAAPKLDSLQRACVDAVAYDLDHLRILGEPLKLVTPGAARLQVAFGHTLTGAEAKALRRRGVIVCRRMPYAVRLMTQLLRCSPAAAA